MGTTQEAARDCGAFKRAWLAIWSRLYRLAEAETAFIDDFPRQIRTVAPSWPTAPLIGLDVGAGVGVYARLMARHAACVVALEPHAAQANFLRALHLDRVDIREAAASRTAGRARLSDRGAGAWRRPEATLETRAAFDWSQDCATLALDDLLPELEQRAPGFATLVKIDVEGHESAVLDGAQTLLARAHVCLLIEIEARHNPDFAAIFQRLAAIGYQAFSYSQGRLTPAGPADVEAMRGRTGGRFAALRGYRNNFIFVRSAAA